MERARVERLSEEGYFLFDPTRFQTTVTSYDPLLANQTLVYGWGSFQLSQDEPASVEIHEDDLSEQLQP